MPQKYYLSQKALDGLVRHAKRHKAKGHPTGLYQIAHLGKNRMGERIYDPKGKSRTITALGGGQGAKTGLYDIPNKGIRRLMPIETERLQGFKDGWTDGQTDGHRYMQLGNAVSVPTTQHILERMMKNAR